MSRCAVVPNKCLVQCEIRSKTGLKLCNTVFCGLSYSSLVDVLSSLSVLSATECASGPGGAGDLE